MSAIASQSVQPSAKEQVLTLLKSLPDNCTLEDVQYGLYVLENIQKGVEAVERGDVVSHEEVKRQMQRWLTK